ncbi:MAG: alanine--tRNA ligase [Bacteroidia bacterium]|nr:alanine--tRNA ligase [Bacteroidia bacterium]MCF8426691.1 alanine--tRNA ligase [Bacteroidia bacterium]MCF8445969.1 alanine--tRNA ligase [Bacteroidia bacterium]
MAKSSEIRKQFLDYFESKGHKIVPSAPIVVKNDPTLMFTNAGMNQFKDWFLGNEEPKYKRVADTQKCLRVSGKHNDLEEVGVDTYHHTMFEMLGNWSFGDYFKKEAIEWAWELLTKVYNLPEDRLYVTVFEGDAKENLAFDQEAYDNWALWIKPERILNGNKKDNFWEMGDTGPCGPCSEIHIDLRPDAERTALDGSTLVNNDHPQVIEIWNNVFMEFNRKADGSLEKLPNQHVDTGMGFERLCRAIEGKSSNYDTDVFLPYIHFLEKHSGKKYGVSEPIDIAMRVLADHIRTISFAILDGQLPSNTGAGYVIRRILRRAVRYYYSFLDNKEPLLYKMVALVGESFVDIFPEVKEKQAFIQQVVKEEEVGFLRTLENGIKRIERIEGDINGLDAFELFDTYGFPIDLTQLIARERGSKVDLEGFEKNLQLQKERSRKATSLETDDWVVLVENDAIQFVGYDTLEAEIEIMRYRKVKNKGKVQFQLVFNQTPFYAESGGQVGDTGIIESANEKLQVLDTQKENNLIIHIVAQLPENPSALFRAKVNKDRRADIQANHSATHLLHAALRETLGTHVEQKGSLVNSEYLRFDFSHFKGMSEEELKQVETRVNQKIRENIALDERRNMPIEEAKELGAMALFGEKYGDSVRVITFDENYSRELCGGTHVKATGEIGLFKFSSESAVAAGVRRIEAITSTAAEKFVVEQDHLVQTLKNLLKAKDLVKSVEQLMEENNELQKKLEVFETEKTQLVKQQLKGQVIARNGFNSLVAKVDISNADQLKNLSFQLKNEIENLFCLLVMESNGKPFISLIISEELVQTKTWDAGKLVKTWAKHIQGGGGGQAFYATAGGNLLSGMETLLSEVEKWVQEN